MFTSLIGCIFVINNRLVVLTVAVRPDGNEITVASLDGQLTFWQPDTAVQLGSIEGRGALGGGRRSTDKVSAKTMEAGKYVLKPFAFDATIWIEKVFLFEFLYMMSIMGVGERQI